MERNPTRRSGVRWFRRTGLPDTRRPARLAEPAVVDAENRNARLPNPLGLITDSNWPKLNDGQPRRVLPSSRRPDFHLPNVQPIMRIEEGTQDIRTPIGLAFFGLFLGAIAISAVEPPAPFGPLPTERHLRWHEMEYYGFIHFTVNTFTDKEWGYGDESPKLFNPSELDPQQWADVAAKPA